MAILTQAQIAGQMVAQLRAFDANVSCEVGTPERKIIDTVAEALAEAQVNTNLVGGQLALSTKYGSNLDNYVGIFGFGRQQGGYATGFVTFGRPTPSPYNIVIANGTQLVGNTTDVNGNAITVTFQTTTAVSLIAGQTSVAAPIQAILPGSIANLPTNAITQFGSLGSPPLGITSVNNLIATTGGSDQETDAQLQVRFQNTVFRNVSGTEDQFLALAVSTQYSTKANVLGPVSRYQEYMQVPSLDDSVGGNGLAGQYTTSLSDNPYAQYVYGNLPNFISNGEVSAATIFYRQDTDFVLNVPPVNAGDTYRESETLGPETPNVTFFNIYTGTDSTVQLVVPEQVVLLEYSYMSAESRNSVAANITNCVDVYVNGQNPTVADAIVPPPAGGVNLFNANPLDKFYYQNFNRIGQPDVNPTPGNIFTGLFWQPVIALPDQIVAGTNTYFIDIHYWPVEDGTLLRNTVRSRNGIEWSATLNGQTTGDPSVTLWTSGQDWNVADEVFYDGVFYAAANATTNDAVVPSSDTTNWTVIATPFSGSPITSPGTTSITVAGYTYDQNIVTLQAALEGAKQVTTDVLAHAADERYFKLDVTVVYSPGASPAATNQAVASSIAAYFAGKYFGTTIQLSDLLAIIRQTSGIQNVRWSRDDDPSVNDVTECDVSGSPRLGGSVYFNQDFYLLDSQLPSLPSGALASDTLPGLVIRPRAQNTFAFPSV